MNVSKLSKVELNRAMIWLYGDSHPIIDLVGVEDFGNKILIDMGEGYDYSPDYLTDWNLTMPLAFENNISIINESGSCWAGTDATAGDGPCIYMDNDVINKDPLRAICEALVMIALEGKND